MPVLPRRLWFKWLSGRGWSDTDWTGRVYSEPLSLRNQNQKFFTQYPEVLGLLWASSITEYFDCGLASFYTQTAHGWVLVPALLSSGPSFLMFQTTQTRTGSVWTVHQNHWLNGSRTAFHPCQFNKGSIKTFLGSKSLLEEKPLGSKFLDGLIYVGGQYFGVQHLRGSKNVGKHFIW